MTLKCVGNTTCKLAMHSLCTHNFGIDSRRDGHTQGHTNHSNCSRQLSNYNSLASRLQPCGHNSCDAHVCDNKPHKRAAQMCVPDPHSPLRVQPAGPAGPASLQAAHYHHHRIRYVPHPACVCCYWAAAAAAASALHTGLCCFQAAR